MVPDPEAIDKNSCVCIQVASVNGVPRNSSCATPVLASVLRQKH